MLQAEGSPHVGRANVFFSHVQALHIALALNSLKVAAMVFPDCLENSFYWFDFFTLRQFQKRAFVPVQIVSVISSIGVALAELDDDFTYLKRSFCILGTYGAVLGRGKLLCLLRKVVMKQTTPSHWRVPNYDLPSVLDAL